MTGEKGAKLTKKKYPYTVYTNIGYFFLFQSLKARETMTLATYQQNVQDLADAVAARAAAVASKTGVLEWRRNCSSCRC